jgi:hypothetical protein
VKVYEIDKTDDLPEELLKKDLFGMGYPYLIQEFNNKVALSSDMCVMLLQIPD